MNWFVYYFIITGLITFAWYYYNFDLMKYPESEDIIADITWNTGISREKVKPLLYSVTILFGWAILPIEIFDRITEVFNIRKD